LLRVIPRSPTNASQPYSPRFHNILHPSEQTAAASMACTKLPRQFFGERHFLDNRRPCCDLRVAGVASYRCSGTPRLLALLAHERRRRISDRPCFSLGWAITGRPFCSCLQSVLSPCQQSDSGSALRLSAWETISGRISIEGWSPGLGATSEPQGGLEARASRRGASSNGLRSERSCGKACCKNFNRPSPCPGHKPDKWLSTKCSLLSKKGV
jgi:hypothetical protein